MRLSISNKGERYLSLGMELTSFGEEGLTLSSLSTESLESLDLQNLTGLGNGSDPRGLLSAGGPVKFK